MDKKFTQKLVFNDQMSIADLFTGVVHGSSSTTASFSDEVESSRFLKVYGEQENRFIPQIDFSTASNFAKFGTATKYYEDSFGRISNQYPYDGSDREKVLWDLSSSYIDKYLFESVYPRTTGFVTFNSSSNTQTTLPSLPGTFYSSSAPEYILFYGGPHADPNGDYKNELSAGPDGPGVSKANIYNTSSNRDNNLEINLNNGVTVEFWMKKDGWSPTDRIRGEIIFCSAVAPSVHATSYFNIYTKNNDVGKIFLSIVSGAAGGFTDVSCDFETGLGDIADHRWHHYAITTKTSGSDTAAKLYLDGVFSSKDVDTNTLNLITGSLVGGLGAMPIDIGNGAWGVGYGNLASASLDEFRYWKTERNAKQIGRYYIDQVYGGTNTDTANTKLGVYYKFNEGITQTASVDKTVLDYSGRITNGTFINYSSTESRATGSAMVISGKAAREFKDPIIYSFHPTVKSTLAKLRIKGDLHDYENANSLINSIPSWIVENDSTEGTGHLSQLVQILSSYLDTLYLQIEALPTLKNINYASSSAKPHFFNNRLLKDYGFNVDEILTDVSLFSYANTRDDKRLFEKKLYDIKNQIYKNIYNNLVYIYKTKGTRKSFRNLLRCIGIDEELIHLNLYGFNTDWQLKTNTRDVASKTKYVDFYNNNHAIVYGYPQGVNTKSFISGSSGSLDGPDKWAAITLEADVVFPKYPLNESKYTKNYTSTTSSLFGMYGVKYPLAPTDTTWPPTLANASASVQVYAIRKQKQTSADNPEVLFMLSGAILGTSLTSSVYTNVYNNSKWKFAVKFKHRNQGQGVDFVSGSINTGIVDIEFYGAQMIGDSVLNKFSLSRARPQGNINTKFGPFIAPKRLYCGADKTNFTGSTIFPSDVFISNLRYWNSYLSDEVLLYHAQNDVSYGTEHPYRNTYLFAGKNSTGLAQTEMPQIAALALNWDFDQVTGSDSNGRFSVADFSSGSNSLNNYKLSKIVERQHTGRGDFFRTSSAEIVEKKFMPSVRLVPFDQINSDDMVEIVDFEEEIFTRESRPVEYFFALEKSMYATISDEMLNMFATIKDFHNLVGAPVNRYRKDYKEMGKLREFFFRRVSNIPDLEKFVEYYKWIDNSISTLLMNLVPATANFSENIRTMVESHTLERSRIQTKYPVLELNQPEPDGRIKAINELLYDWKHGHAPLSDLQNNNCLWWHDRAKRSNSVITSGDSEVDTERETIKRTVNSVVSGSTYVLRKLTRPYRFSVNRSEDFTIDNIKLNFVKAELDRSNRTENVIFQNVESYKNCNDNEALKTKRKLDFQAKVGEQLLKGRLVAPFTLFSSSVDTGYKAALSTFRADVAINDNHIDAYGTETQAPLQGPFTKIHVGGKKCRKVAPFTPSGSRPEEYNLTVNPSNITLSQRGVHEPKSKYFLDEIAKRPVVIKNIKTETSSLYLGNYSKDYQIVQTVGANTQRGWLRDNSDLATQLTPEVLSLSGNLNFNTYARTGSSLQSVVIADRFSAPGSPQAMSLGYLDPASHTFSVYNNLNYRNMTVRLARTGIQHTESAGYRDRLFRTLRTDAPLNTLHRSHMLQDGYLVYLNTTASLHKVNRNRVYRMESNLSSTLMLSDDFESGLDLSVWSMSAGTERKQDTLASTWAVALSGSGDADNLRWLQTDNKFKGPLKVQYKFIAGTNPPYDPSGLDLERPTAGEDLFFQYSSDGTTWLTASIHLGIPNPDPCSYCGVWTPHTVTIGSPTASYYLRWYQPNWTSTTPPLGAYDQWAIDDPTKRSTIFLDYGICHQNAAWIFYMLDRYSFS